MPDLFETFEADAIRLQSTNNKQGSSGLLRDEEWVKPVTINGESITGSDASTLLELGLNNGIAQARNNYQAALMMGVAREQARNVLPLATYTEFYWKIDLHNLLHFLSLRLDAHAQLEIREFAQAIANIVQEWVPHVWEAFEDYRLNGTTLSRQELTVIKAISSGWAWAACLCQEKTVESVQAYCTEHSLRFLTVDELIANKISFYRLVPPARAAVMAYYGIKNAREQTELLQKLGIE